MSMEGTTPGQDEALAELARMIASSPHNLVSRGDREILASVHIPEALAVGAVITPEPGQRWMDLGTGGGLPGLALAVAHPEATWVLLDSTRKKLDAVTSFAAALGLRNVETVAERAETAGHAKGHRAAYDGVVARAVAPLPTLVELARGFVSAGGRLAAVKGPAWSVELTAAREAMRVLGWRDATGIHLTSTERPTWVVTMTASGPPPQGFPRRVGVPGQDPLTAR